MIKKITLLFILISLSILSFSESLLQQKEADRELKIVLEIDVAELLQRLVYDKNDFRFSKALEQSVEEYRSGAGIDFVSIFVEKYDSIDNRNLTLANLFSEKCDKIKNTDDDAKVRQILKDEVRTTLDSSLIIFQNRLKAIGISDVQIVKTNKPECVEVYLFGIDNIEQIQKLLVKSADVEFWRTYDISHMMNYLESIDERSQNILAKQQATIDQSQKYKFDKPFFTYFEPVVGYNKAVVGLVSINDTAAVNQILVLSKELYPLDLKFAWTVRPIATDQNLLELYVLKGSGIKRGPALANCEFTSVEVKERSSNTLYSLINFQMDSFDAYNWAKITGSEIGNNIAIVINDYVYSAPIVNQKIEGGKCSISGDYSHDELKFIEIALKTGQIPATLQLLQEKVVSDSIKH